MATQQVDGGYSYLITYVTNIPTTNVPATMPLAEIVATSSTANADFAIWAFPVPNEPVPGIKGLNPSNEYWYKQSVTCDPSTITSLIITPSSLTGTAINLSTAYPGAPTASRLEPQATSWSTDPPTVPKNWNKWTFTGTDAASGNTLYVRLLFNPASTSNSKSIQGVAWGLQTTASPTQGVRPSGSFSFQAVMPANVTIYWATSFWQPSS